MEYVVICTVALLASGLTLISGFGLGTLLLPAFLVYFPAPVAVSMTAVVHFLANVVKLAMMGRHARRGVLLRFGLPAIPAALLGAWLLVQLGQSEPLLAYDMLGATREIHAVNLAMGVLIVGFAVLEVHPRLRRLEFGPKLLPLGGFVSGFFGGLSGHQGALRSAFLVRAGLTKESFVGTGVVIACLVDATRISLYASTFSAGDLGSHLALMIGATVSAVVGVFLGRRILASTTFDAVRWIVAALLIVVGLGVATGLY